ncbi:Pre-mRNA-processing protein prp40 [Leucoagaricus sp. SymC.cos]|nr:Pre-mRNA-processing protein prp40 [Leucoagaricus sp. SymC.cos]
MRYFCELLTAEIHKDFGEDFQGKSNHSGKAGGLKLGELTRDDLYVPVFIPVIYLSSNDHDEGEVAIEQFKLKMNIWTEHRNPEGRTYWFNTGTKQSVWEKPDVFIAQTTFLQRALSKTKWKEYFSHGKKYYYNTETKESKWEMPDEIMQHIEEAQEESKQLAAQNAGQPRAIGAPGFTPVGGATQGALVPMGGADTSSSTPSSQPHQANGTSSSNTGTPSLAVGAHTGSNGLPLAANSVLPARPHLPDDPVIPHNGFATVEEGEKAFVHLLKKAGVDANWTWDQTMRAIITDPLYKALNTLAEKKTCWEKYTNGLRAKEQEEKEARLAKLRPAIRNMLRGNPNVFHYSTFRTADKLFAQHPIWQQARIEAERKLIFEEYVTELKQREMQESRAARTRSVSKVVALFKELNVDVVTRWKTAHNMITESDEYKADPELQKLPSLDILLAKERKAREAFKGLLQDLVNKGKIKARTKWKEVYPNFKTDERYLNMLGNPGSNPLELFWDAVDALDQKLDAKVTVVEDVLRQWSFVVGVDTSEEEYLSIIKINATEAVNKLAAEDLREVFNALKDTASKRRADEKRRAERKQRHLQDDLRYAMKKLPEPINITLSYEEIVPLIESLPEYKALEDEEGRRAAFAKYVKRQKERMREAASEDGGSTTSRKRKEPHKEYKEEKEGKERDRDRESRPRYDRDEAPSGHMDVDKRAASTRAETPEEGEI